MLRINGVLNASHFSWQRASEMQLKTIDKSVCTVHGSCTDMQYVGLRSVL